MQRRCRHGREPNASSDDAVHAQFLHSVFKSTIAPMPTADEHSSQDAFEQALKTRLRNRRDDVDTATSDEI